MEPFQKFHHLKLRRQYTDLQYWQASELWNNDIEHIIIVCLSGNGQSALQVMITTTYYPHLRAEETELQAK